MIKIFEIQNDCDNEKNGFLRIRGRCSVEKKSQTTQALGTKVILFRCNGNGKIN